MDDFFNDIAMTTNTLEPEVAEKVNEVLHVRGNLETAFVETLMSLVNSSAGIEMPEEQRAQLDRVFVMARDDLEKLRVMLFQKKEGE
jgi:GMP synthase PP-ATPase subunit